jgi:DNA-directed RNA polymerase subunit RPC12/RpoP
LFGGYAKRTTSLPIVIGERHENIDWASCARFVLPRDGAEPVTIETLGEAWRLGWRVRVRCAWGKHDGMKTIRACIFKAELDMETLVCTRGRDFPLSWLQERLRCPRCGSRRVAVMFEPPANRAITAGRR